MALEIRTEYVIYDEGAVVGYVWRKEDPMHYWIEKTFASKAEGVLFKRHVELEYAVHYGIVRPTPERRIGHE